MISRRGIFAAFGGAALAAQPQRIRALIVDGRHNHDWRLTTPLLKRHLEATKLFSVDVTTAPPDNAALASFVPEFHRYRLVLPNYTDFGNGGTWPAGTKGAFSSYVAGGGGVVIVHAASSAFPEWKEFNEIIGLGGWGGRDERWGPYIRFREGGFARDSAPGKAGHHGRQHRFAVTIRQPNHPVTAGLPPAWMHASDELFDSLRGPARNLEVLATAYSEPATGGSGQHEPALFVVRHGQGRVFHTILGHGPEAMRCTGFITTLQRGAEWVATGNVRQAVPEDFPTQNEVRTR